jgi:hypothetical protein
VSLPSLSACLPTRSRIHLWLPSPPGTNTSYLDCQQSLVLIFHSLGSNHVKEVSGGLTIKWKPTSL